MAEPHCIDVAIVEVFFFFWFIMKFWKKSHTYIHMYVHTHILKYGAYLNTSGDYTNTENLYFLILNTYFRGCDQNA